MNNQTNWKENYLSYKRLRKSKADPNRKPEEGDARTPIESDFGRVIFSESCRRLHDKTQVFPLTNDDNIHSRLTHSLEVMNVGYSFALALSKNDEFKRRTGLSEEDVMHDVSSVLKTSCLVHDIGNPPFGHFGEDCFQDYFKRLFTAIENEITQNIESEEKGQSIKYKNIIIRKELEDKNDVVSRVTALKGLLELCHGDTAYDYTQFDGNAEGFRVLTKLQYQDDLYGLNLTYATLASSVKYPNVGTKKKAKDGNDIIGNHKHGVFTSESEYLDVIAKECNLFDDKGLYKRHPFAFLMEAADSICYLVMDIEDAIGKGWLNINGVIRLLHDLVPDEGKLWVSDLSKNILSQKVPERKKRVNLRTELFNYLIKVAVNNFVGHLNEIGQGTYHRELIEDDKQGISQALGKICQTQILCKRDIQSLEVTGNAVISGLFDIYINLLFNENKGFRRRGKSLISRTIFQAVLHEHLANTVEDKDNIRADEEMVDFDVDNFTIEERLRLIRDFVACMTDKFALNHYRKLSGQQIS